MGCTVLFCIVFGLLVGLVGAIAAQHYRIPQQMGWVTPPAERLFSSTPDREFAEAVKQELARAGIDTKGMEIYVLPITGKETSVVVAVLDASQGFRFGSAGGRDPVIDYMNRLGTSAAAKQARAERVAIDYRSGDGQSVLALTARTDDIAGFARGSVSRQQFMQRLDGNADWPLFFQEVVK